MNDLCLGTLVWVFSVFVVLWSVSCNLIVFDSLACVLLHLVSHLCSCLHSVCISVFLFSVSLLCLSFCFLFASWFLPFSGQGGHVGTSFLLSVMM